MATLNVAVRATPVLMSEEATFGVVCHTTLCSIFGDTAFLCVCNFYRAMMMIKGSLFLSAPLLSVFGKKTHVLAKN